MIVEMTETKDDINNDYDYYKWAILVSFDLLILIGHIYLFTNENNDNKVEKKLAIIIQIHE
ncbi:hypothetical protein DERP_003374 [Dermatophagoides pteronyssinus]|uniref:Uncharacterized protein n=1 Tax=Dermatophagoides pteronyssinus TaxID=6956 RepID=A0ABQ8JJT0_DERPT|nr:hypothetical protein DERP_003374 [Dermatophagoides pteronyssinus]